MEAIIKIINSIKDTQPNVNPTEVYNEGWMIRLLVYYSIEEEIKLKKDQFVIDFINMKNWTSEALISNPFLEAKKFKEGYTHADMALGDFEVHYSKSGKIEVLKKARRFGIIEAKMKSSLSIRTTHAATYDQASRNVACIAYNTKKDCDIFFYVVAPELQLNKVNRKGNKMADIVVKERIIEQIEKRFKLHNSKNKLLKNQKTILEQASRCNVGVITYEEWIKEFTNNKVHKILEDFYHQCIKWNNI